MLRKKSSKREKRGAFSPQRIRKQTKKKNFDERVPALALPGWDRIGPFLSQASRTTMLFSGQCVDGNSTVCIITQKPTVEAGMRLDYPTPCTCIENIPGNSKNEINIHFLGLTYWVQCTILTEQQRGFVCTSVNAEFTSWLNAFYVRIQLSG